MKADKTAYINITPAQIVSILEDSGYYDCPLLSLDYQGETNSGWMIFATTYMNDADEIEGGKIYLCFHESGQVTAEF